MKRYIFTGICLLCLSIMVVSSQPVSEAFARQVAMRFLASQNADTRTLDSTCEVLSIGDTVAPAMYAVSMDSDWVLVSADERVEPILAYSDNHQGRFPSLDEMPPAMIELLDWYEQMISSVRQGNGLRANSSWAKYKNENIDEIESIRSEVAPFLKRSGQLVAWGQSGNNSTVPNSYAIYNLACPSGNGCAHTLAGCVAVAMAQVMWYWRWPLYAVVKDDNNQYLFRDYDWSEIPHQLTNRSSIEEVSGVANLLHDVGTAVFMNYDCNGSSASTSNVPYALRNTFGYTANNLIYRTNYTDSSWIALLKSDLDKGWPIIYRGTLMNENSGHAFVLHGYDSNDRFYINFGWKGDGDGYYSLNSIPYGTDCFCRYQAAVTGIHRQLPSCNAITIQPTTSWSTGFTCINGGGIIIGNRAVLSVQTGRIYSNDYVQLTTGFSIHAGANVHIAIRPILCSPFHQLSSSDSIMEVESVRSKSPAYISQVANDSYLVSPNPAMDHITISCSEPLVITTIYNLNGMAVLRTTDVEFNVSSLPAGIYLVQSQTTQGEVYQVKMVHL